VAHLHGWQVSTGCWLRASAPPLIELLDILIDWLASFSQGKESMTPKKMLQYLFWPNLGNHKLSLPPYSLVTYRQLWFTAKDDLIGAWTPGGNGSSGLLERLITKDKELLLFHFSPCMIPINLTTVYNISCWYVCLFSF
jgi:hypothetical protein